MEGDFAPRTLDAPAGGMLFAGQGGKAIGEDERRRMLAEVRAGAAPEKLTVTALVFRQDDEPNRNRIRFKPGLLNSLAKSFVGAPVLRDHDQQNLLARGGKVTAAEFTPGERKGHGEIRATFELVKPWAIEAALDGTMDRFSIGWHNTAPVVCSECDAPFVSGLFGGPTCSHSPGDVLENKDGTKRVVELVVTGASGTEVSAVNVPAVEGTGIEHVRAQLSLARQEAAQRRPATNERIPMKTIAEKLGLTDAADEAAILATIERLRVEREAAGALQAAELAAHAETRGLLAAAQEKLAAYAKAETEAALEKVTGVVEGKLGKGEQSKAAIASALKIASTIGVAEALAFAESLPKLSPVGEPLQSRGTAPDQAGERGVLTKLTAQQKDIAKQLKITEAQMLAQLNAQQVG